MQRCWDSVTTAVGVEQGGRGCMWGEDEDNGGTVQQRVKEDKESQVSSVGKETSRHKGLEGCHSGGS